MEMRKTGYLKRLLLYMTEELASIGYSRKYHRRYILLATDQNAVRKSSHVQLWYWAVLEGNRKEEIDEERDIHGCYLGSVILGDLTDQAPKTNPVTLHPLQAGSN
jgi:hypothetical protein